MPHLYHLKNQIISQHRPFMLFFPAVFALPFDVWWTNHQMADHTVLPPSMAYDCLAP